VIVTSSIL